MPRHKDPAKRAAKRARRERARRLAELRMHQHARDGGLQERLAQQERAEKLAARCTVCEGHGRVAVRTRTEGRPDELVARTCWECNGSGRAEE